MLPEKHECPSETEYVKPFNVDLVEFFMNVFHFLGIWIVNFIILSNFVAPAYYEQHFAVAQNMEFQCFVNFNINFCSVCRALLVDERDDTIRYDTHSDRSECDSKLINSILLIGFD